MSWGRGAINARKHVCLSLLPPHNTRLLTQQSSCSREPGREFRCCSQALRSEHSHESEGLEKCEMCARACVCNVHSQHMATEVKYSLSTAGSCFLLLTLDPSQSESLFSLLPSNMLSSSHLPLLGGLLLPLHFSFSPFLRLITKIVLF